MLGTIGMAKLAMQLKNKKDEESKRKLDNLKSTLQTGGNTLGGLLQQFSQSSDGTANEKVAAAGGALQGISAGSSQGLLGMLIGGALGGSFGFAGAAQSNADYYDTKDIERKLELEGSSYSPDINMMKDGGLVVEDTIMEPAQMDKGEHYVTSDMSIYKSKSKDKHENMNKDEVTDFLQPRSFVTSERKKLKPSDHSEDNLGYSYAYYKENGDYDLEEVKFGDVIGSSNKKKSFSQALKSISNKYAVKGDDNKHADIFTQVTDKENKRARVPFVNHLIKLHEGNVKQIKSRDTVEPKKYATGGFSSHYDLINKNLNKLEGEIEESYNRSQEEGDRVFRNMKGSSALGSLISASTIGMQSTRVDPNIVESTFADSMFEEVSPAVREQLSDDNFSRINSLTSNIAEVDPEAAGNAVPKMLDKVLRANNQLNSDFISKNLEQRRSKYRFLNKVRTTNSAERNRAREATRDLINQKQKALGSTINNYLTRSQNIEANELEYDRSSRKDYNSNRMSLLNKRTNTEGTKSRFDARIEFNDQLREQVMNTLKEYQNESNSNEGNTDDFDVNGGLIDYQREQDLQDIESIYGDINRRNVG